MKNKINWKQELSKAFSPSGPMPTRKSNFLYTLPYPKLSYTEFLLKQFFYLSKKIWLLSGSLIFITFILSKSTFKWLTSTSILGNIWIISALLPFLVLLTMAELLHSSYYCMVELEMSCRFSYYQVTMARIFWLGIGNFSVLIILLLIIEENSLYDLSQIVIYLITPYLLTSGLCLSLLNYIPTKKGLYGCAIISCFISIFNCISNDLLLFIYSTKYFYQWIFIALLSLIICLIQLFSFLKRMEEKQWNLFLTE